MIFNISFRKNYKSNESPNTRMQPQQQCILLWSWQSQNKYIKGYNKLMAGYCESKKNRVLYCVASCASLLFIILMSDFGQELKPHFPISQHNARMESPST